MKTITAIYETKVIAIEEFADEGHNEIISKEYSDSIIIPKVNKIDGYIRKVYIRENELSKELNIPKDYELYTYVFVYAVSVSYENNIDGHNIDEMIFTTLEKAEAFIKECNEAINAFYLKD